MPVLRFSLLLLFVACSSAPSSAPDATSAPDASGAPGDADAGDAGATDVGGTRLGPEGGIVRSADGRAQLEVPPGALDEVVDLALEPRSDVEGAVPGTSWALSPSGIEFAVPVLLSMPYDPAAFSSTTAAARPEIVKVYDDGHLAAQPTVFDARTNTATAALGGFSSYSIWNGPRTSTIDAVTASYGNGAVTLGWTPSTPVLADHFTIERAGPFLAPPRESDWQLLSEVPARLRDFADTGPFTADAIYWYRVRAVRGADVGAPRAMFVGTFGARPARPLAFTATVVGTDVTLEWDAFAVPFVTEFRLATELDGGRDRSPRTIPNTISQLRFVNVIPGHSYRYVLTAIQNGVEITSEAELVVLEGFFLEVTPNLVRVRAGESVRTALTVHRAGAFTAPVQHRLYSAGGSIAGITATFSENPSTLGTVSVELSVDASVPTGRYNLIVEGDGGGHRHAVALNVDVDPTSGFDFTVTPSTMVVRSGGGPSYQLMVTRFGGFSDPITFELVNPPRFLQYSSPPSEGGGYFIIGEAEPGVYSMIIRGTSGMLVREQTVLIEVVGAPETSWFLVQNRYDSYVHLSWADVPGATGYSIQRYGVEIAHRPAGFTTYLDRAPNNSRMSYTLQVELGPERSVGRTLYYTWSDPADAYVLEMVARCRPAAQTCDPPVELELAGDESMSLEVYASPSQCNHTALEVLVDGQLHATSAVYGPGLPGASLTLTPSGGVHQYGFRAVGQPGFGCIDAAGTLDGWGATLVLDMNP